jgi:hypothetical protein
LDHNTIIAASGPGSPSALGSEAPARSSLDVPGFLSLYNLLLLFVVIVKILAANQILVVVWDPLLIHPRVTNHSLFTTIVRSNEKKRRPSENFSIMDDEPV